MSDVEISYNGASIGGLSETGTKILSTAGKYCEDDITIFYTKAERGLPETPTDAIIIYSPYEFTLKTARGEKNWNGTLQYSTDYTTWDTWVGATTLTSALSDGWHKLYLRGTNNTYISYSNTESSAWVFTGRYGRVCGNMNTLLTYNNPPTKLTSNNTFAYLFYNWANVDFDVTLPATTLTNSCYHGMFAGCAALTVMPILPATTLTSQCYTKMFTGCVSLVTTSPLPATTLATKCYSSMFENCTSLTSAPTLPATNLIEYCYSQMFYNCTSLITAPAVSGTTVNQYCCDRMFYGCTALTTASVTLSASTVNPYCCDSMFYNCTKLSNLSITLSATTLAYGCYQYMFYGCKSLTTAPALPATTLGDRCYYYMFRGCTSLTAAPALPATTLVDYCYYDMFYGCTSLTTMSAISATTMTGSYNCYYMFYNCSSLTTLPSLSTTALAVFCYGSMFNGCTKIKLSTTQTGDYQTPYRIPSSGTGTVDSNSLNSMFSGTGGTFKGAPTINTTYYTSNTVVSPT